MAASYRLARRASKVFSLRPLLNPLRPYDLGVNSPTGFREYHKFSQFRAAGDDPQPYYVECTNTQFTNAPLSAVHYLAKIDSFSLLNKLGIDKYETGVFEAGGYKWKLVIYPNGYGVEKNGDKVSVNLALADTSGLPENWEINAIFTISMSSQLSDNYISITGRTRFHANKTESGISKQANQLCDTFVLGADVFVNETNAITEYISSKDVKVPFRQRFMITTSPYSQYEWDSQKTWNSDEFTAGGHNWKIEVYPNGVRDTTGRFASIYLKHVVSDNSFEKVKASYTICLKNHYWKDRHVSGARDGHWFSACARSCGWASFIDIESLFGPEKGYIVNNCCYVDIELSVDKMEG